MTYESLSGFATGSMLGSGGFIVYDDTFVSLEILGISPFYHHESCGNVHLVVKEQDG
jgi:NADH-quinone oxidoreductase subunit F